MNKNYLFLAAAATILASCAQSEKLNNNLADNSKPTAIGFTSYSEKATRGDINTATNLEYYHNTFAVYATKQDETVLTDIQYVFGGKAEAPGTQDGVVCTYQTTADALLGDWKYDDPRFWDKHATYDFIAYAPASVKNPIRYYYAAADGQVADNGNKFISTADYTLEGTNLQKTASQQESIKGFNVTTDEDLDLMTSGSVEETGNTHSSFVNLSFRHILSKLNVRISQPESMYRSVITIKEVKITGFKDSGSYDESDYDASATPKVSGWTAKTDDANYQLIYNKAGGQVLDKGQYVDDDSDPSTPEVFQAGKPYYFIESLVMPQDISNDQVTLTIKYNIASGSYNEDRTYPLDLYDIAALQKFYDGNNYTLSFVIEPDVIKYDASVSTWADNYIANQIISQ